MKRKTIKTGLFAVCLALGVIATGCAKTETPTTPPTTPGEEHAISTQEGANTGTEATGNVLKIGASPSPHAEILEAAKPFLAEKGIELEIVEFSDYVLPNLALEDGSLDANYFQHEPYLIDFNEGNGTTLVNAAFIHYEPMGLYPGKTAKLEDLANGAKIAVPNDATNEARALLLLEAQGLITLNEGAGIEATPRDIKDNPKNIEIIEVEASQTPAVLPDVDFAVVNSNFALSAGIIDTALVREDKDSVAADYANIIAVRSGEENDPRITTFVEVLKSDEIKAFINDKYQGAIVVSGE